MTAIRVDQIGQFANQAFCYLFAKVLAARTGLDYRCPANWLDKQGRRLQWSTAPMFAMWPTAGRVGTNERHVRLRGGHWFDLAGIEHATRITCRLGYYQRYEYYRPHRDQIRDEWLRLQVPHCPTDPEAVYCHVRRRDYLPTPERPVTHRQQPLASTIDEYAACLRHFPDARSLVLCTDDPRDPFLYEFARFGLPVTINGGTWDRDLLTLLSADHLLICQSTYSWLAGFLGRAQRIVCPVFPGTHWRLGLDGGLVGPPSNGDFPSLCVDDDPRWIWEKGE
jgi:hypothetical protein